MLDKFFDLSKLGGDYVELIEKVREGKPVSAFGMGTSERVLSSISLGKQVLFIVSDYVSARRVYESFEQVIGEKAALLPVGSDVFIFKRAQSNENNVLRMKTLFDLATKKCEVVVASIDALFSFVPKPKDFVENIIKVSKKQNIDIKQLTKSLVKIGYTREALVSEAGQFSVRGDIIDIFPIQSKKAYRIELFDTEVESIKEMECMTQKSTNPINEFFVCPFTNLFFENEERKQIAEKLEKIKTNQKNDNIIFQNSVNEIKERLLSNENGFSLDFLFPLCESKLSSIFDYLNKDACVVIDECKMVFDSANSFYKELQQRKEMLESSGELLMGGFGYVEKKNVFEKINLFSRLGFLKVTTTNNFFKAEYVFSFKTNPVLRYTHNFKEFVKEMNSWLFNEYKVFVLARDEKGAKQISKSLANYDIFIDIKKHASISDSSSAILPYEFTNGFVLPSRKIVVIGTYDILPRKQNENKLLRSRENVFSVPRIGDYVVHQIHGVGLCEGVTKLTGKFGTKDFIIVKYRDDDTLYVPIDQMDLLDRFSGADTPKKLSKIGGVEFSGIKEKVRQSIKKMAFDLLELYAERESKKGFSFVKDDFVQMEFENNFPYTETEDQLVSLSEIKKDMESEKVMDRLLCGDVGFGKTEVALRAAFKAVLSGKQVAFLAPTTILSEQHYNTCLHRFQNFGVRIGVLNRFRTEKETKEILERLKNGEIDIICGTHRLLSKDVKFKDLGFIILDEEQKFGVEDKEKIKLGKKTVDVLTLSATPIPRTLHMSLSGIRDVSIISTPPSERLPIQTYVTEFSESTVKDAINREMSRGGQVFFVYNRVESIYGFAEKIRSLVPEAKIVVGHGQLPGNELEDVIYKFYNKMADVLICTTIIENGIDLANANTLIVFDADKFGLSQLYQIRGRVGRSNRMAYAYFMYNKEKVLTEDAYKRLEAISEFTEFGSGFKIAMRDLEIRGSGNILGSEQHGHMQKVGYDMYCKLLKEAVDGLKGKVHFEKKDVLMKISIDAFIPEGYIVDSESRMTAYKNISNISTKIDKEKVENEMIDVFGKLPVETKNLIDIAYAKALAKRLDIVEVISSPTEVKLVFDKDSKNIVSESVANAIFKFAAFTVLNMGLVPTISFNVVGKTNKECFELVKEFLEIANLKK